VTGFLRHPSNWSRAAGGAAARLIERGDAALKWFNGDLRGEIAAAARTAVERVRLRHGSGPVDWRWARPTGPIGGIHSAALDRRRSIVGEHRLTVARIASATPVPVNPPSPPRPVPSTA
jgi:hypothetical protein